MSPEYGFPTIEMFSEMVKEAGGHFIGVQQGLTEDAEPFVLFLNPSSSNPVSLPVSQMTLENVKHKLGYKNTPTAKRLQLNSLSRKVFHLVEELHKVANEIEELKNAEK